MPRLMSAAFTPHTLSMFVRRGGGGGGGDDSLCIPSWHAMHFRLEVAIGVSCLVKYETKYKLPA